MKPLILFISYLFINLWCFGQETAISFPSKTSVDAETLGKYNLFPINQYTGISTVNIPVHEINFDGLKIPIQLNYSTGGIKVAQDASKVGLGWSLSDNAVIIRQINGHDDFFKNGYLEQPKITDLMAENDFYSKQYQIPDSNSTIPDTQADLFILNLFGKSVTFNFINKAENNGTLGIFKHEKNNITIQFNEDNFSFRIVDEQGFIYHFSNIELTDTYSKSYGTGSLVGSDEYCSNAYVSVVNRNVSKVKSSWYLTEVISPNKKKLSFSYDKQISITQPNLGETVEFMLCGTDSNGRVDNYYYSCSRNVIEGKILKQIISDDQTINIKFYNSSRQDILHPDNSMVYNAKGPSAYRDDVPLKLDSIIVFNSQNDEIVKTSLTYSYFNNNKLVTVNDNKKSTYENNANWTRLKLDEVKVNNKEYALSYVLENNLPKKTSKSIDFWGFYNGKNNSKLVPNYFETAVCPPPHGVMSMKVNGGDRSSDFDYGKIGLLNRITYPTKGYLKLNYQPNDVFYREIKSEFSRQYLQNSYTSLFYDNINISPSIAPETSSKTYTFKTPSSADSRVSIDFNVSFNCTPTGKSCKTVFNELIDHPKRFRIVDVQTGSVVHTLQLMYSTTAEKYWDGNELIAFSDNRTHNILLYSNKNYRVEVEALPFNYEYSVYGNVQFKAFKEDDGFNIEVGGAKIASLENYDANDQKLSSRTYDYHYSGNESSGILMNELIYNGKDFKIDNNGFSFKGGLTNTISSSSIIGIENSAQGSHIGYSQVKETFTSNTNNFENTGYIINRYKNDANLVDKHTSHKIYYNYPYTYRLSNGSLRESVTYSDDNKEKKRIQYQYLNENSNSKAQYKFYYQASGFGVILNTPISTSSVSKVLNYSFYEKAFFPQKIIESKDGIIQEKNYRYNNRYLLKSESTKDSKSGTIETSYQYAHEKNDTRLINENRIGIPLQTTVKKGGTTVSDQLTQYETFGDLYLPKSVFSKKGGVVSKATTDRKLTYDRYDAKGNVLQYHTEDGLYTSILWGYNGQYPVAKVEGAIYDEISSYANNIGSLRAGVPKAMVTTYTYEPLVGVTSITDPNGQVQRFEYDEFNRLKRIKDHTGKVLKAYDYQYKTQE
ncbi:hypothetical protein UJ101_00858 [Flavobacteriaceae bacterium UJ101]|nr:hypothetical protein UJ101_00858 [Flavobacteriaceae bacterium UJ101]